MTATSKTRIHTIDDKTVIEFLNRVFSHFGDDKRAGHVTIIRGVTLPLIEIDPSTIPEHRYAFRRFDATLRVDSERSVSLIVNRFDKHNHSVDAPIVGYDDIEVSLNEDVSLWSGEKNKILELQTMISELDAPGAEVANDFADPVRQLLITANATHARMQESLSEQIQDLNNRRIQLHEEAARNESERQQALQTKLDELEAKRAELELQSHMAERRRILNGLVERAAEDVRKNLTPPNARISATLVFVAALLLALGSGCVTYTSINQLDIRLSGVDEIIASLGPEANAPQIVAAIESLIAPTNWYLIIRSIVSSIIALGAFAYAAGWMRRYYNEEIAARRQIERLNADLARASWIIEAVLEVQYEKKGEIPEAWINSVTSGLFQEPSISKIDDAALALKALMGFTASASFGPDGAKVDLNSRGAKRLSRAEPE
jgi:hypothetical protein